MAQEYVTVAAYSTAPEAHIARGMLESAGIPAVLCNEHIVGVNPVYMLAVGGVELRVPTAFAQEAGQLLEGDASREAEAAQENAAAACPPDGLPAALPAVCPHCGGALEKRPLRWPAIVLFLLFFSPPPTTRSYLRCVRCGKKMR